MRMARAPDFVAGHGAAQHHRIAAQPQYLRHHHLCTYSHPGRVLLRLGEGICVGAPPRCEPRGHPSPVIGAFYGVHCSKSPAGRVQSGFQSPSPRGRKLMSERGVLLVNLGSPASTEVADVRRYLNQFLMDPCVVDLPWLPRRLLVSLILLRRPKASAEAYASIWWEEGSPLVVISQRVRDQLRSRLDMPVELAMRYGEPSIEQGILALVQQGVSEILLMHQYPQFADSTITTVVREARRVIDQHGLKVRLTELPAFHDRPDYLEALAESARP